MSSTKTHHYHFRQLWHVLFSPRRSPSHVAKLQHLGLQSCRDSGSKSRFECTTTAWHRVCILYFRPAQLLYPQRRPCTRENLSNWPPSSPPQGPVLVRGETQLSSQGVQQYWTASKCRLDRWTRNLKSFAADATHSDATAARVKWSFLRGVLEEVLTGEVLTRVWTALLCLYDRHRGASEFESLARSIMIGHMEARHRVLILLVREPGVDAEGAVKLNHLRRRAERWTDLLVGHLAQLGDVSEFACDVERGSSFRETSITSRTSKAADTPGRCCKPRFAPRFAVAWRRSAPTKTSTPKSARRFSASFPGDLFDSTGLFRSLWLHRMANVTSDVEVMIDSLVGSGSSREGEGLERFGR